MCELGGLCGTFFEVRESLHGSPAEGSVGGLWEDIGHRGREGREEG